ncbi:complex I NDUFA9 subunit family protein [Breoghania sp.]|uniref:complex I NDUFA9 subunit family protein n=1 Tax=Breoghania sp. TaxID=2065378 RepID=UPI002AA84C6F|nr:complex I NDUFA9 subunit family protein [Breoghania sp.]
MTTPLNGKLVTVFGGSGFVGRHVVHALARRGWRVRVAVRRPDLAFHLQPLGSVGQIHAVQANLRYPDSVAHAVTGSDAVVNLVGILSQSGRQTFDAVQAFGARAVAQACKDAGITDLVHMSAIGADANSPSGYGRSKAAGEAAVRELVPQAVIMRPSILFGPEDDFFNRFASMARMSPVLPLIGGGKTRFQPVFVGDVAEAVARAVEGEAEAGATYELGGAQVKTFRECMEMMLEITARKRLFVPLSFRMAGSLARVLQMIPGSPLTKDQVAMLKSDNVVSEEAVAAGHTLSGLGITPVTLAAILPGYLWRFRVHGQFDSAYHAK